jgi:hypothetical protein
MAFYYLLWVIIVITYMLLCWVDVFDLITGYRPFLVYFYPDLSRSFLFLSFLFSFSSD